VYDASFKEKNMKKVYLLIEAYNDDQANHVVAAYDSEEKAVQAAEQLAEKRGGYKRGIDLLNYKFGDYDTPSRPIFTNKEGNPRGYYGKITIEDRYIR
jgi:hypothetical protein